MQEFKLYQNLGHTDSSMIEDTYILMKGIIKTRNFENKDEFQLHKNSNFDNFP